MIYRPEISACDHCGKCCQRGPCLLAGIEDVERLQKHNVKAKLNIERNPEGVRIRVAKSGEPCPYHIDNRCSIQDAKPTGGREFECWNLETFQPVYFWKKSDLQELGYG